MKSLLPYNTFGLEVFAKDIFFVEDVKSLYDFHEAKYIILGKGSDVLFTENYEGVVVISKLKGIEIKKEDSFYKVRVGGGEVLDDVIKYLLDKGITGLENLSAIPGTVGAAPVQNIGAYGVEIGDYIESIEVFDLDTKEEKIINKEDCKFSYRSSIFKERKDKHYFISYINFSFNNVFTPNLSYKGLENSDKLDALEIRKMVIALRNKKLPDPRFVGNAGSFFKNPIVSLDTVNKLREKQKDIPVFVNEDGSYKVAAGFLIDKANCKGITHGRAGTWEHQALVLVNRGMAQPHEIVALGKYICNCVKHTFDIDLYPEVRIFGKEGEISWESLN